MRIAALILVLMLVVAIATEVNGILGRRRRRRKPSPKPTPKPTPGPCDSCSCCKKTSSKRSVDLDSNIYPNDASLLKDYYSHYKSLPLGARDVIKGIEKRPLVYPGDCSTSKLLNFAGSCGFCITPGKHWKVCSGNETVTMIPHTVKPGTCRKIINKLNSRPECQDA